MNAEEFAKSSYARDRKVGSAGSWLSDKDSYMEEAEYYMTLPKEEWPCHILCEMKEHALHHGPSCQDTDI